MVGFVYKKAGIKCKYSIAALKFNTFLIIADSSFPNTQSAMVRPIWPYDLSASDPKRQSSTRTSYCANKIN